MRRLFTLAASALLTAAGTSAAQNPYGSPFLEAVRPVEGERAESESPFADRIETDRDAYTPTVKTVGPGRWVIESAYSFIDNRGTYETHSYPELLLRYGLTRRLELRLGWNYEVGGGGNEVSSGGRSESGGNEPSTEESHGLTRESRLTYGIKVGVTGQDGWIPESALLVLGMTPTEGDVTATTASAAYVFGWELPNEWRFDVGLRGTTAVEEGDHFNVWSPSAVLRVPVEERWTVHVEYFGALSSEKAEDYRNHYASTGVSFLVTPDLEIGVRGGWGLTDTSARGFVNAGFGWRY